MLARARATTASVAYPFRQWPVRIQYPISNRSLPSLGWRPAAPTKTFVAFSQRNIPKSSPDSKRESERERFLADEGEINELADRIKEEGLIQPVVLNHVGEGRYRVIAGHMRVEACKRLGWRSLPATVRNGEQRGIDRFGLDVGAGQGER